VGQVIGFVLSNKQSWGRPLRLTGCAALKKAGVPVEMHLHAHGGHGFGLRRTKFPITEWPQLGETWLGTIGMIPK